MISPLITLLKGYRREYKLSSIIQYGIGGMTGVELKNVLDELPCKSSLRQITSRRCVTGSKVVPGRLRERVESFSPDFTPVLLRCPLTNLPLQTSFRSKDYFEQCSA
jgi:hypothetical protein